MKRVTTAVAYTIAPILCLLAPITLFLTSNNYPLLREEVGLLFLVTTLLGLLVTLARRVFGFGFANVLIFIFFLSAIIIIYPFNTVYSVLAFALFCSLFIFLAGDSTAKLIAIAAFIHISITLTIFLPVRHEDTNAQVAKTQSSMISRESDLAPLLHIVLDEFTGLKGFPDELAYSGIVRKQLAEYFVNNDFKIYSNAYSQYLKTINSLPNLFNFTSGDASLAGLKVHPSNAHSLEKNNYFKYLQDLGYTINVYQTDYLDFCKTPSIKIDNCRTYELNPTRVVAASNVSAWQKSVFLLKSILDSSTSVRMLRLEYLRFREKQNLHLPNWPAGNSKTGPLAALPLVNDLTQRLRTIRRSEAYFVHLMIPHFPYIFRKDCSVRPRVNEWLNRVPFEVADRLDDATHGLEEQNDEESRLLRYQLYIDQILCTKKILDEFFQVIKERGQWNDIIILVHGDHGTRIFRKIPTIENYHDLSSDDYRDAYSTLFAVKNDFLQPGLDNRKLPLQTLLAQAWRLPDPKIKADTVFLTAPVSQNMKEAKLIGFD